MTVVGNHMNNIEIIAYYLPQFHTIPENDEWWGKGFTEWRSVGNAKPLFRGHYQPKVPADLGYYNLLDSSVRDEQVELARKAGVTGFAYWHYWFGNGKQLLEKPFNAVLQTGSPNFPFCLAWANESWKSKVWSDTSGKSHKTLIEQVYPGAEDNEKHFLSCLAAFHDSRYIRYNNQPVFIIYRPFQFEQMSEFISQWNKLVKQHGIAEKFYFIANISNEIEKEDALKLGFDAVTISPMSRCSVIKKYSILEKIRKKILIYLFHRPVVMKYSRAMRKFWKPDFDMQEDVVPFILPNWDHSPRSGMHSFVLHKSTPQLFEKHAKEVLEGVAKKKNKFCILKSWNEWGEGNYMEPDLKFGQGYIKALRLAIKSIEGCSSDEENANLK